MNLLTVAAHNNHMHQRPEPQQQGLQTNDADIKQISIIVLIAKDTSWDIIKEIINQKEYYFIGII